MTGTTAIKGRLEDERLIRGEGRYIADVVLPGMAHAVMVRSPHAHALVRGIDAQAARCMPGVVAVLTAAELAADGIGDLPCGVELTRADGQKAHQARRPVLARDRVRHVGEAVAVVIAESPAQASAAAEAVIVDYEDLPAVIGAQAARAADSAQVWPEAPGNSAFVWSKGDNGAVDRAIAAAAHVARLKTHVTRVNVNTIEPRGAIGSVDPAGRLVLHSAHQSPYQLRDALAGMLKVAREAVRVIAGDVGGSFGMKSGLYAEDVAVLWAARRLGRPVRWIAERTESFLVDDHGRDVHIDAELALDKDGRFLALRCRFGVDIGAYLSGRSLFMLNNIGGIAGVYRIGHIVGAIEGVFTHTQTVAPYRGAGRPEATFALERLIDVAARDLGVSPYELRRRNLVPPEAMPYDTGFTFTYDCGEFEETMKGAAELADLAGFEARRAEAARRGRLRGLGIANPIEVAGGPFTRPVKDHAWLKVAGDGTVTLHAGAMSTGQGHRTAFSQLVAATLGVPLASIRYAAGDTDDLPGGRGNGGSSAMSTGGSVVLGVLDKVIAKGKAVAADLLEASTADIAFQDGRFRIVGTDRSVPLLEVARRAELDSEAGLADGHEFQPTKVTFPNGCHMCEVEIDPETGALDVLRYTVVEDIGRVINEQIAFGQIHGGIAQGLGQAIGERTAYDPETGQLVTASFMDYVMPRADDLPALQVDTRPVPTKVNPVGAKGVGEAGTVGALAATINAVCDALAPFGIRDLAMPATPDRIWAAIAAAKR